MVENSILFRSTPYGTTSQQLSTDHDLNTSKSYNTIILLVFEYYILLN